MSDNSKIEWTEATWNPVRGCTKVSPGCANCYAETFAERWRGVKGHPYEQGFDLRLAPHKLTEPLSWKKPRKVFVNSMSDLFQDGVPDEYIDRVFAVMALAPQHTFQVLTKRADRVRTYMAAHDIGLRWLAAIYRNHHGERVDDMAYQESDAVRWAREGLENVWLGVSVENQRFADERIPLLLQTPAAVRFISAEPLLGAVDLDRGGWSFLGPLRPPPGNKRGWEHGLDWVIVGGESGPESRPFDVAWARAIVAQCQAAGVACFVKQLGAFAYDGAQQSCDAAACCVHDYTRLKLRKKGGDPSEWPEDLRVREFPASARTDR